MSVQVSKECPKCETLHMHEQTSTGMWRCVNCGTEHN